MKKEPDSAGKVNQNGLKVENTSLNYNINHDQNCQNQSKIHYILGATWAPIRRLFPKIFKQEPNRSSLLGAQKVRLL